VETSALALLPRLSAQLCSRPVQQPCCSWLAVASDNPVLVLYRYINSTSASYRGQTRRFKSTNVYNPGAIQHWIQTLNLIRKHVINGHKCHGTEGTMMVTGKLVCWLFNGTSTPKGQFVPTPGEGNQFSRLRIANEIQCILPYVS